MEKTSIIIPTLNEADSIGKVIDDIKGVADEIIIVDGFSPDQTATEAENHGAKALLFEGKKGAAVRWGFTKATGDYLIMMDADGSHDVDEINQMINKLKEGHDVVMPSRFMEGGGSEDITGLRVFGNNFYKFWVRLFWDVSYTDICYGFRGFTKEGLAKLDLKADDFDIELEISIKTAKKSLKYVEIPSFEKTREHGHGKLNFWTSLKLDRRILIELLGG